MFLSFFEVFIMNKVLIRKKLIVYNECLAGIKDFIIDGKRHSFQEKKMRDYYILLGKITILKELLEGKYD